MANTAYTQLALAADPAFLLRVKAALLVVTAQILGENSATANHGARVTYANKVIVTPESEAAKVAPFLVMRPNVNNFTTSWSDTVGHFVTTSGDPDLQSQVATDWDWLAAL